MLERDDREAGSAGTDAGTAEAHQRRADDVTQEANGLALIGPVVPVGQVKRGQEDLLRQLLDLVTEVRDLIVSQRLVRDFYSTEQAAQFLGRANWTVREWCRLGRVHAEKRHSGRGRSQEWVISHAELLRIQKEGLLPLPKH